MARRSRRIVGREDELAQLRAAAAQADAGAPRLVVIQGEAGIGKSRLVDELATELRDGGAVVATGHGVDLDGASLPYGVVAALVRDLRTAVGAERVLGILGSRAAAIGSLDPSLGVPPAEQTERPQVFEAVQHLVLELARERLLCLVLEDLHWADASSSDLVTFLATTVGSGRLLLVVTTRPEGGSRLARLVTLGELLTLRPLDDDAIRELVADLGGAQGAAPLEQTVVLAQGVPLYAEELVAAQRTAPSRVPAALGLTFAARTASLGPDARVLLEALAVAGTDAPSALLAAVVREKRSVVAAAIDEAVGRGLVDLLDRDRLRFHHELLRRAVIDTMSPIARAEWHRRWALTLRGLPDVDRADPSVLAALARHWFESGDQSRAVPAGVRAARAASGIGAATEAAGHWHRALMDWHRAPGAEAVVGLTREEALVEGTTVLRLAGAYAEWHDVLTTERARPVSDGVLRLWLDLCLAHVSGRLGSPRPQPVTREQLPSVLDRLADEPRRPLVRAVLFWLWWDAYDAERHLVERILDLIDEQGDPVAQPRDAVAVKVRRARLAAMHGDAEGALGMVRSLPAHEEALHAVDRPVVESLEVWLLLLLGRLSECIGTGERALAHLDPHLAGASWAGVADNLAAAHALAGDLDRAEELMRTVTRIGDVAATAVTSCDLVALLVAQGRQQEAEALLGDLLAHRLPGPGEAGYRFGLSSQVAAARACVAAAAGDLVTARQILLPVLTDPHVATDSEYLWSIVLDAGRLFDDPPTLEPWEERARWVAAVRDAAARTHAYGALGPVWTADVAAHLDRALERDRVDQWVAVKEGWRGIGAVPAAARAGLRLACRLAQDGLRDRAADEAAWALAEAERVGAARLVDDVRAAARRHRLRLDGDDADRREGAGLTAREREVLALLADGRTNEQIGTELYMSPKTASVHVSRIIAKLGVTNRTEAAAFAHRRGLVRSDGG